MSQLGYFGKTPHRGDFVRFNLPKAFVTVWDDWLQQLMITGEQKYTSQWSTIYETAPSYRFALSTDIAGDSTWAGILLPSVDKVGRRFPFCIVASLPKGEQPAGLLSSPPQWFEKLISLAEGVNDPDYDFAHLQDELAELVAQIRPTEQPTESIHGERPHDYLKIIADSSSALNHVTSSAALLDSVLNQFAFQYSIWVTHTNTDEGVTYLSNGLPWSDDGLSLFDQVWDTGKGVSVRGVQPNIQSTPLAAASPGVVGSLTEKKPGSFGWKASSVVEPVLHEEKESPEQTLDNIPEAKPPPIDNEPPVDISPLSEDDSADVMELEAPSTENGADFEMTENEQTEPKVPKVETLDIEDDGASVEPWET